MSEAKRTVGRKRLTNRDATHIKKKLYDACGHTYARKVNCYSSFALKRSRDGEMMKWLEIYKYMLIPIKKMCLGI